MPDNGSGMNAIVAIVAVIVIAAIAYFAVTMLTNKTENQPGINVNLGADTGGGTDGTNY